MKPEVKELWLSALRGGEYHQGKNLLHKSFPEDHRPDEFCCLGVLCDLAVKNGVILSQDVHILQGRVEEYSYIEYQGSSSFLPDAVQKWSGVWSDNGSFDDGTDSLVRLNDDGIPFLNIANVIEENF